MDNTAKSFAQTIISKLESIIHLVQRLADTQEKHKSSTGSEDSAKEQDHGGQIIAPSRVPPQIPPTPLNREKATQCHYQPTPRWKLIAEGVAIFFGIVYAIVTTLQWWDLRQHFKIEQRAWLKVTYAFPNNITPDTLLNAQVENVGKSGASYSTADSVFEIVNKDRSPSFNRSTKRVGSEHEL